MGFSIGYDIGAIGGLLIVLLISAGLIALVFLLVAARRARSDVLHDQDDDGQLM
jgi:hypothetical protein